MARFLKLHGISRVQHKDKLDAFWEPLLPKTWPSPPHSTDLLKRVPVPAFFQNQSVSIAIDSVNGDSQLVTTAINTQMTVEQPGGATLQSIGLVLDSDHDPKTTAVERFSRIASKLANHGLPLAQAPGQIVPGPPRTGIFVLPDNASAGTLEDLLIDCANVQYPQLLASARTHISSVQAQVPPYVEKDLVDFLKPAGGKKALVGSIGAVLRPGKAIQVSIQDNNWLDGNALNLPRVKAFRDFVDALL